MGEETAKKLFTKGLPKLKEIILGKGYDMQIIIKLEMEGCRSSCTEPLKHCENSA